VGENGGNNLIQMARGSQNEIFGLDLAGSFSNGIYGFNMEQAIAKENDIASAGGNGIFLFATNPPTSQFVHIDDNTVISAGQAGIRVESIFDNGSSFSQTVTIDDNTVLHSVAKGIYVDAVVKNGSTLNQNVTIDPNTVISNGRAGINVELFVTNATPSRSVVVADNVVEANAANRGAGIYLGAIARTSGSPT